FFIVIAAVGCLAQFGCSNAHSSTDTNPMTGQVNPNPSADPGTEDGQWPMPAKNFESTRYSGLDQINTSNVGALKVAWTFSTGIDRGQEAAPIVVGDTMYVVTPF